ncbi:MAG: pyridoxine 5'-phosphate synthase, partial [Victivallaceae bacterium]|nr:pyridoxine 5'-phosphate synthase [Victivallaceae bacterium]
MRLGVNVDHVATVRQARRAVKPDPVEAALLAQQGGAWGITAHLREDRRHIDDTDIAALVKQVERLNMEMAVTDEMVRIALAVKPHSCCLVPEKRQELTTEGGLDAAGQFEKVSSAVNRLRETGIKVSLFIDPEEKQLDAASKMGSDYVELHTGAYSNATGAAQQRELARLKHAAAYGHNLGLSVNAGHGIDYENIKGILEVPYLSE